MWGTRHESCDTLRPMRMSAFFLLLLTPAFALERQPAQNDSKPMPPSEAFQYAMQPFNDARQQSDDLTDADRWALGISIARAAKACKDYVPLGLPKADTELLAMGRLCILGQQYEPAREALTGYLSIPTAPERETAFLLLARAFLGLGWITSAESPIESLLSQFPYDANIHYGVDQVVDEARAQNAESEEVVRRLNEQQLPFILKALHGNGSLTTTDKSATVSTAVLFRDTLRCAAQLRADGKTNDAASLFAELSAIASEERFAQSAELPAIQASLKRYELVGQLSPVKSLHAKRMTSRDALVPITISVIRKTTVLLPVALWAPSSSDVVQKVATSFKAAGADTVLYAITSFAANTGGNDKLDPNIAKTLGALRQSLPANVQLLIVDNDMLEAFAIDNYPSGIVIDKSGTIRFLEPLNTGGAIRALRKSSHLELRAKENVALE